MRKPSRREAELDESREIDEADIPLLSRIDGADPLDAIRRGEIRNKLEAALAALPVYHRGVIVMREVEGMSYEEMAEAMGVSKGTIMSRLFHARQKLQRALADCYAEEVAPTVRGRKSGWFRASSSWATTTPRCRSPKRAWSRARWSKTPRCSKSW